MRRDGLGERIQRSFHVESGRGRVFHVKRKRGLPEPLLVAWPVGPRSQRTNTRLDRLQTNRSDLALPEGTNESAANMGFSYRGAGANEDDALRSEVTQCPISRSIPPKASAAVDSSASVRSARTVTRRRDVPAGTVGGRMGSTVIPTFASAALHWSAFTSVPKMIGRTGPMSFATRIPFSSNAARKRTPTSLTRSRPASSALASVTAPRPTAAKIGLDPVEKTNERARFQSHRQRSRDPATKAP